MNPNDERPHRLDEHQGLRNALDAIARDPRGWSGRAGRELLTETQRVLTPAARRCDAHPSEAMAAAWELWTTRDLSAVTNLWAYTTVAVSHMLQREREAQTKLTSASGLRRRSAEYAKFENADLEYMALDLVELDEERGTRDMWAALRHVRYHLIMAGHSVEDCDRVLDHLCDCIAAAATLGAAADRLCRDTATGERLGFSPGAWRALITFMVGTPRGLPGLIILTARGHPDPLGLRRIARAGERFLTQSTAAEKADE